jgi:type II secretory pathway pseudopilin PulG
MKLNPPIFQKNAGFGRCAYTLIEVLVASLSLGIIMATFFLGLVGGYSIINTSRQDLRATQILTQKTEFVRLCTWSQLNGLPSTFKDYYYSLGATNSSTTNVVYYGTISVGSAGSVIPGSPSYINQIKLVTISLAWTNNFGLHPVGHSRQMQTLVAYYGLVNYIYGSGFVQQ